MFRHYCNVLCVESSVFDFELTRHSILQKFSNVHPLHAKDAAMALDAIRVWDFRPSLLVVDPRLQRQGGHGLIARLKRSSNALRAPIVVFSRDDDEIQQANCLKAGADAWFPKPQTVDEYEATVQTIIRRWTTRRRCPMSFDRSPCGNPSQDRTRRDAWTPRSPDRLLSRHAGERARGRARNSESLESLLTTIA